MADRVVARELRNERRVFRERTLERGPVERTNPLVTRRRKRKGSHPERSVL
jgi:hypothetical protein